MINEMKPNALLSPSSFHRSYPEYKDSGVEWLGPIPVHWEVMLLKRAFNVQLGKMLQSTPASPDDSLEPYLRAANIFWNGVDLNDVKEMWFSPYEKLQYALEEGDLLASEGGDVGRATIWKGELEHCYIQNAINRVRSKGVDSTYFLYYWIYTLKHFGYIDMLCNKATIAHFTAEKVERVEVILPSPAEQCAIVTFLDRETAKIDTLIAKKERLIELLQEKRAALISHAVTKGLDPDVPMKDSGIEWLGEIPAHWRVTRLRFIADSIQTGPFGSQLHSEEYISSGTPLINPANIQNGRIVPDLDCTIDDPTLRRLSRYELKEDDIVFARRGEMGRCALVTNIEAGWLCGTGSIRIRLRTELCYSPYLHLVLSGQGIKDWLSLESVGSTMENLNSSILSRMPVPNPSKLEQQAIATYIDCETTKLDALIAKTQETIEKLKEYRMALISAAVTGKIDVRETISTNGGDDGETS